LAEFQYQLGSLDPAEFLGANNSKLHLIKNVFPNVKVVFRGDLLKILGEEEDVTDFKQKFEPVIQHYTKYTKLSADDLSLMLVDETAPPTKISANEPIVYGANGTVVKARTKNQAALVEASLKNDMVFAIGPAGSGKTYTAVAMAVRALKNKEVKKIVLTRPAVEAGENLGFLPGDLKDKIDPYLRPLYDALNDMMPEGKLQTYIDNGIVEICPLAFMRGRTLDKAFVILDEAQNTNELQMKMVLTRMGPTSKYIITGDLTQIDLPRTQRSGLAQAIKILKNVEGIAFIYLTAEDVVRHRIVKNIIKAYDHHDNTTPQHPQQIPNNG
jgi:phosphate starvation-inducible PhoH-like protein